MDNFMEYGIAVVIVSIVVRELVGLIKWLIARRNGNNNSLANDRRDSSKHILQKIAETQRLGIKILEQNSQILSDINNRTVEINTKLGNK